MPEPSEAKHSASVQSAPAEHSRFYWFLHHSVVGIWTRIRSRPKLSFALVVLLLVVAFLQRAYLHPLTLFVRKNLSVIIALVILCLLLQRLWERSEWKGKLLTATLAALLVVGGWFSGRSVYQYCELYMRFHSLEMRDLDELPLTDHERIQPLNSVYSLAYEVMTDTEAPQTPDFVRVGDAYHWTLAIEPSYPISRMFGEVEELLSIPGTTPSPSFGKRHRKTVQFPVGESLLFSRSSRVSTIRALGFWRFFSFEPEDVKYVQNSKGKWVQVVSLVRWRGFFFPQPTFGGVQIVEQTDESFFESITRWLFGTGTWIPPEAIAENDFLHGQNLVPYSVSRHTANSFRFQDGFFSPFPGYHEGDIRIPDLEADVNNQPFTTYFTVNEKETGKLYNYFALEPFDRDKQGLNTSLFLPADGIGPVFLYRHPERGSALTGVSAIAAKVMESKKNYDWSKNRPVEHRPFIRLIDGHRRFFWLTTVVTDKENDPQRFIAGSIPEVVLTDAEFNTPIWVDPLKPEGWMDEVERSMSSVWAEASSSSTAVEKAPRNPIEEQD